MQNGVTKVLLFAAIACVWGAATSLGASDTSLGSSNPTNPVYAESETGEVQAAARLLGMELILLNASTLGKIEAAFAKLEQQPVEGLFVSSDGFLLNHSDKIADLTARHALPAIYGWRQAVALGGLISYGTYFPAAWRLAGAYPLASLRARNRPTCRSRKSPRSN